VTPAAILTIAPFEFWTPHILLLESTTNRSKLLSVVATVVILPVGVIFMILSWVTDEAEVAYTL
jgi:hypothetical protein